MLLKRMSSLRIDYIGATWCKVCHTVKPAIEKIGKEFGLEVVIYDVDEIGEAAPNKVPTVRLFKNDVLLKEFVTKHADSLKDALVVEKGIVLNDDF